MRCVKAWEWDHNQYTYRSPISNNKQCHAKSLVIPATTCSANHLLVAFIYHIVAGITSGFCYMRNYMYMLAVMFPVHDWLPNRNYVASFLAMPLCGQIGV